MKTKLKAFAIALLGLIFSTCTLIPAHAQVGPAGMKVTVTTSGTAVALSSSALLVRNFQICATAANTGTMWLGSSAVLASSGNGGPLAAKECTGWISLGGTPVLYDLHKFFVDASVSGESVSVLYTK